jgi:hypothetical protein
MLPLKREFLDRFWNIVISKMVLNSDKRAHTQPDPKVPERRWSRKRRTFQWEQRPINGGNSRREIFEENSCGSSG